MSLLYTYDKSDNPLLASAQKIDESFLAGDAVSMPAQTAMTIAAFKHGEACKSVIWSSSWSEVDAMRRSNTPTGFQFTVDSQSCVVPALFSHDMYATTMAFPLDAGANSRFVTAKRAAAGDDELEVVGETHFASNYAAIAGNFNALMSDDVINSSVHNFSGVFATETRSATGYEKSFWVVARVSHPAVAAKIRAKINEAKSDDPHKSAEYIYKLSEANFNSDPTRVGMASPHTTWRELFVGDSEMLALRDRQIDACARVVLQTIRASGLGSVASGSKSTVAENVGALLANQRLVKSVVNDVDNVAPGGRDLAFLSEMSSVHSDTNGFVFRETPQLGVSLYGPSSRPPPKTPDGKATLIGMPCSSGHLRSVNTHVASKTLVASELKMRMPFVWSSGSSANVLLSSTLHRPTATDQWAKAADKIGLCASSRSVLHLKPVVVKMATTLQPKK